MEKTDVVVIGAGGSGLVAALTAAEGCARVTVFEKMRFPGGTTNFPTGPFAVESKIQRQKEVGLTKDEAFKIFMDYSHWRANALLVRAYVDKSANTIDWLQRQGVEFTEPAAITRGGHRTWHLIKGHGAAMVKVLVARGQEKGVDIRLTTPVKKLVKEGDYITGVIAEDKSGKTIELNSKAVIIATNGYASNKKWIKRYGGFEVGRDLFFPRGELHLTGEGIQMAWDVGAAEEGMGVIETPYGLPGPGLDGTQLGVVAHQPYLWINQHGNRFCDEGIAENWPFAANAIARQKNRYAYLVFDGNTRNYLAEEGTDVLNGPILATTQIVNLDGDIKKARSKGNENVFTAHSLQGLARKIGVKPNVLQATVNKYNKFCEKNHDEQFAKNPQYLQPVRKPSFYAFRIFPFYFGTLGGIKVNEKTEVLNKEDEVIPGLYAVGNVAGGMTGDSYNLYLPGGSLGFALNSGRIAGENALEYLRKLAFSRKDRRK
jgi:fumarate reductase flavoprotein subunit